MTREQWIARFDQMGITAKDWSRIKALALTVTPYYSPAALDDLDCDFRIGAVMLEGRRYVSGVMIGKWQGRAILAWPKK